MAADEVEHRLTELNRRFEALARHSRTLVERSIHLRARSQALQLRVYEIKQRRSERFAGRDGASAR